MMARSMTREAGWLTLAGLLVSFHRLAMGFYLSDAEAEGIMAAGLVVLGGLAALVLTGAQMLIASALATVRDRILEVSWWILLVCAVLVMSASTLASMHGAPLAEVVAPDWLAARQPAVVLAVGLSLAIELSLAAIRRASILVAKAAEADDPLGLTSAEQAELEVQQELARRLGDSVDDSGDGIATEVVPVGEVVRRCPWCSWSVTRPTVLQAANSVRAHQRFCSKRPA